MARAKFEGCKKVHVAMCLKEKETWNIREHL